MASALAAQVNANPADFGIDQNVALNDLSTYLATS
jgi:hypothetical protein